MNAPDASDVTSAPAVFLDRDGVLNRAFADGSGPLPPRAIADVEILPGVAVACAELHRHGLTLIVVTNQPDVARGTLTLETLDGINDALRSELPLDDIVVCVHDDADGCGCRKPAPGMLVDAARRHHVSLERSVMVGDRWRDIEAGKAAGCQTVFIDHGYDERRPEFPDAVATSLLDAVPAILGMTGRDDAQGVVPA